jgi:hypothetical protein
MFLIKKLLNKNSNSRLHTKILRKNSSARRTSPLSVLHETTYTSPQFEVGFKNGFLSRSPPMEELPSRFSKLEQIIRDMPYAEGGLLSQLKFGETILKDLPLYKVD